MLRRRPAHFNLGCGGELYSGDCRDALASMAEASIDAAVTDPPYHLTSIVKRFGGDGAAPTRGVYQRHARGFMGQTWDGGAVAFDPETWRAVLRVLKPGAHLLAFGGSRTYHRLVCAIEDAGFEVRDCVLWLHGQGFPKSHNVSRGIDRELGVAPTVIEEKRFVRSADAVWTAGEASGLFDPGEHVHVRTAPTSPEAERWRGWGTALKPACELIVLARKPLSERNTAANVLRHGTGALNIDGTRVGMNGGTTGSNYARTGLFGIGGKCDIETLDAGRWPANVILEDADAVTAMFPEAPGQLRDIVGDEPSVPFGGHVFGHGLDRQPFPRKPDAGSASRFFYQSKADVGDRFSFKHPTVKPVDLMAYLIRLVVPRGAVVLDPFAGTGSTGEAAWREGVRAVLCEREGRYQQYIHERYRLLAAGGPARAIAIAQERERRRGAADAPGALFAPYANAPAPSEFSRRHVYREFSDHHRPRRLDVKE